MKFAPLFAVTIAALIGLSGAASADPREKIGSARLFNNDAFGDGKDRWRSSSYQWGHIRGRTEWTGARSQSFGDTIEYRYRAEIIAPRNLETVDPTDRPYVGVRGVGLHTHFGRGDYEMSAGLDMMFTGEQTGQGTFQTAIHKIIGVTKPSDAILGNQVGNALHPTLTYDLSRPFAMGDTGIIRPFVETTYGIEDMVRIGVDFLDGAGVRDQLIVRDTVTGMPILATKSAQAGYTFIMGGDIAYVADSAYLPEGSAPAVKETRGRLRAGVDWQGKRGGGAFLGLTYLGEEFEGQTSGQTLGSLRVNFKF